MAKYENDISDRQTGDWVRQTFFRSRLGGADEHVSKFNSMAELNFYDTSPGGNRSINCPHQFTDHCDPRPQTKYGSDSGMGRYYHNAIDRNAQRVSFAFGVPEYNSLTRFFKYYYDRDLAKLVDTGEAPGVFFKLGEALGTLFTLPIQAIFGLEALYTRVKSFATNTPYSKFYYMRPMMPLYWTAVSLMVNQLSNKLGVTSGMSPDQVGEDGTLKNASLKADIETLNRTIPEIAVGDGKHGIDIYALSTRAQRRANAFEENMNAAMASLGTNASLDEIQKRMVEITDNPNSYISKSSTPDLTKYMERYSKSEFSKGTSMINLSRRSEEDDPTTPTKPNVDTPRDKGAIKNFAEEFQAQVRDGSAFATFEVQHIGPISESFSNTTKESAISSALNTAAGAAKDLKFNFSNGNLADGVIGGTITSVINAVGDLVGGGLKSIGLDGLAATSRVEIPELYDNSTADLGNTNYTIVLSTPYGNKMSVLMDLYIPLCMILAGALPRSTGKNSFGSPFLCRMFHQGTGDVKTGIIESVNITRGGGNVGLTRDRLPTTIEVSISVKNLDPIMHMPISESLSSELAGFSHFDEPNTLSNYLSALSGMSLSETFYIASRLNLAWEQTKVDWRSAFSSARMAQTASNTLPGSIWRSFSRASTLYD